MSPKTVFKLTKNQVSASLSGESVILNHKKGEYYSLNEAGALVWSKLSEESVPFLELKETIVGSFDVEDSVAESDLIALLNDLMNEGLVEQV